MCAREVVRRAKPEAEVLVHMRRFPQDGLLDHLAMTGQLTPDIMTDIAHQLGAVSRSRRRGPHIDRFGQPRQRAYPDYAELRQTPSYIRPHGERHDPCTLAVLG